MNPKLTKIILKGTLLIISLNTIALSAVFTGYLKPSLLTFITLFTALTAGSLLIAAVTSRKIIRTLNNIDLNAPQKSLPCKELRPLTEKLEMQSRQINTHI